jgi:hypothetical protein
MGCWGTSLPWYQIPSSPWLSIGSVPKLGPKWAASNTSFSYGYILYPKRFSFQDGNSNSCQTTRFIDFWCLTPIFSLGMRSFCSLQWGNAKRQMPVLMCRCRWHRPGIEGQVVNPTAHLIHGMPGRIPVLTVPQQNGVKMNLILWIFMEHFRGNYVTWFSKAKGIDGLSSWIFSLFLPARWIYI